MLQPYRSSLLEHKHGDISPTYESVVEGIVNKISFDGRKSKIGW